MQAPIILVLLLNHNYRNSPLFFNISAVDKTQTPFKGIFVIPSLDNINEETKPEVINVAG